MIEFETLTRKRTSVWVLHTQTNTKPNKHAPFDSKTLLISNSHKYPRNPVGASVVVVHSSPITLVSELGGNLFLSKTPSEESGGSPVPPLTPHEGSATPG